MFICNHCPFVVHVIDELVRIGNDYKSQGIGFVAISSNDVANYPNDSPEKMKQLATVTSFPFPYLYDEDQVQQYDGNVEHHALRKPKAAPGHLGLPRKPRPRKHIQLPEHAMLLETGLLELLAAVSDTRVLEPLFHGSRREVQPRPMGDSRPAYMAWKT